MLSSNKLVYKHIKSEFVEHIRKNQIVDKIQEGMYASGFGRASPSEVRSWQNSLHFMRNVLDDDSISDDIGIGLEFNIPQTSKRIDVILTGFGGFHNRRSAVIVELKQWSNVDVTFRDGVVRTFLGGRERDVPHPSYQAWSYAATLEDYNETIQNQKVALSPCAYLHNSKSIEIKADFYKEHLERAPVFLQNDFEQLQDFIRQNIRKGDRGELLYEIAAGKIRPSKSLIDHLSSLLEGNKEFILIDEQKVVYETALELAKIDSEAPKQVLVVEGGPGTGKSVVAINLLVELTRQEQVVQYVSRNAAPREVFSSRLAQTHKKTRINNLFKGSGAYHSAPENSFDTLVVDEAHRLNEKSGFYQNLGENQIAEIIRAAKTSIFFIDERQRVTLADIGRVSEIAEQAQAEGAEVTFMELESQFRCNGSDGYIAWIDNALQIRRTAHNDLSGIDFDFRVFDSPSDMKREIVRLDGGEKQARLVAGYCWDWRSKKDPSLNDIVFPQYGFSAQWNLTEDGSLWIEKEHSIKQVGCIHTCQGLEIDYIGVIIGPDFLIRDGKVITDGFARSHHDRTIRGFKTLYKSSPEYAKAIVDEITKNTYRTLMTRGMKGCFIWSEDEETREYFRYHAQRRLEIQPD